MDGKLSANLRLFILGILYSSVQAANPSFVTEPTDNTQIIAYENTYHFFVTLNCGIRNLQTGQTVAWYKNSVQISNNGFVYSNYVDTNRYTVDMFVPASYATFNLKVMTSAASADIDSGEYQCVVMTTPPLESRTAHLNVFVTPESGDLRCSIGDDPDDDVFDVETGTPILLACRSDPTGVPEMTTYWTREGSQGDTFDTVAGIDPSDGSRVLSFLWIPTNQQNHATFTCTGFHPGYSTNKTCQLGPFNVQYKPIVQISPSSYTITMETQVVTFTCIADANPPATRYVWSNTAGDKFSQQNDNVIIGSDGTWMQMRNFDSQDNDVYIVTCYAENNIGKSVTAIATLIINIRSISTITTTFTPTKSDISGYRRTPSRASLNPLSTPLSTEDGLDISSVSTVSLEKLLSSPRRDNTSTTITVLSTMVTILTLVVIVGTIVFVNCCIAVRKNSRIPFTQYTVHKECIQGHSRDAKMSHVQTLDATSMTHIGRYPVDSVQYEEISKDNHGTEDYQSLNPTPKDVYTSLNDVKVIEKAH